MRDNKPGMKDTIIQMLVKAVLAAVLIIGSLTGASTLISKVLNVNASTTQEVQK